MAKDDDQTPATKADIARLEQLIRTVAGEAQYFFAADAKSLAKDFQGIFKDRTEQHSEKLADHETRLQAVEQQFNGKPAA
jgi:hypothetical protein